MGIQRDLGRIQLHAFQQPFRCCNLTAVAYALTALGHSTSLDDLVHGLRIPIAALLDDGMTLSETFDVCSRHIQLARLPLTARHMHFDRPEVTAEWFIQEVESGAVSTDNIHILNFNVRIAHDHAGLEGGHFSLLADFDAQSGLVTIADTNPKRYSRFWTCPVDRLFEACVDRDAVSERSRGVIIVERIASSAADGAIAAT